MNNMMKIHIKNLGILRQAEFALGDLTILCGDNNTGKTYATYALFGFLSLWRKIFSIQVHNNEIDQLFAEGTVHIDVTQYLQNATQVLSEGCRAYTEQFPMIFAAPADRFKQTEFQVSLDWQDITPTTRYEHRIRTAGKKLFFITKNEGYLVTKLRLVMPASQALLGKPKSRRIS
jgi:predicted ATPase